MSNSLDPTQVSILPDLGPNCLQTLPAAGKEFKIEGMLPHKLK